jgi:hypothetical protein
MPISLVGTTFNCGDGRASPLPDYSPFLEKTGARFCQRLGRAHAIEQTISVAISWCGAHFKPQSTFWHAEGATHSAHSDTIRRPVQFVLFGHGCESRWRWWRRS